MKICHWVKYVGSGSGKLGFLLCEKEKSLGLDSFVCSVDETPESGYDADVHVIHSLYPEALRSRLKSHKTVMVQHSTPEHTFNSAVNEAVGYGFNDGWMQAQYWLRTADAFVTFWPRHRDIWQSMVPKEREVKLVPLGVDKEYWKKLPSRGRWAGDPSLFTCDAWYQIKWPLDLFFVWERINNEVPGSCLHVTGMLPHLQRWFFPLVNTNGASYSSHISSTFFPDNDLRNVYNSVDFQIGLVQKGDFNCVSLEANACGTKTISYKGNPYSDFWLNEGDQREMAKELIAILKGEVEPRQKEEVPDITETAQAMKEIYEQL